MNPAVCGELIGGLGILAYFVLWIFVVTIFFSDTLDPGQHLLIAFVVAVPVLLLLAFKVAPWVCS